MTFSYWTQKKLGPTYTEQLPCKIIKMIPRHTKVLKGLFNDDLSRLGHLSEPKLTGASLRKIKWVHGAPEFEIFDNLL